MTDTLNVKITAAGRRAMFNPTQTGFQATLSHLAFGDGPHEPTGNEEALVNERHRTPIINGQWSGDDTIHVDYLLDVDVVFNVFEIGLYLDDGTLWGIWASPDAPRFQASDALKVASGFDIFVKNITPENISINVLDPDFSLFFGTEFANTGIAITDLYRRVLDLTLRLNEADKRIIALVDRGQRLNEIENIAIDNHRRLSELEAN